jgi:hypothetical protein
MPETLGVASPTSVPGHLSLSGARGEETTQCPFRLAHQKTVRTAAARIEGAQRQPSSGATYLRMLSITWAL